ncbi:hypothetical protein NDU88_004390 [Pleurodeles waltl]|uniref:Uncharacterized protein n=1 Tax=Pleurodeles waltl TaxID=8319 RepID=A0AAV7L6K9_PLEWA|nr:hypothetical protein NDU88_004390 [Pleurodeles waltl]
MMAAAWVAEECGDHEGVPSSVASGSANPIPPPLVPVAQGGGKDCRGGRCPRSERETTEDLHSCINRAECCPVSRQEIATTAKELKREVVELEQRVDTVERNHDAQAEELDHHRQDLLTFQDGNR